MTMKTFTSINNFAAFIVVTSFMINHASWLTTAAGIADRPSLLRVQHQPLLIAYQIQEKNAVPQLNIMDMLGSQYEVLRALHETVEVGGSISLSDHVSFSFSMSFSYPYVEGDASNLFGDYGQGSSGEGTQTSTGNTKDGAPNGAKAKDLVDTTIMKRQTLHDQGNAQTSYNNNGEGEDLLEMGGSWTWFDDVSFSYDPDLSFSMSFSYPDIEGDYDNPIGHKGKEDSRNQFGGNGEDSIAEETQTGSNKYGTPNGGEADNDADTTTTETETTHDQDNALTLTSNKNKDGKDNAESSAAEASKRSNGDRWFGGAVSLIVVAGCITSLVAAVFLFTHRKFFIPVSSGWLLINSDQASALTGSAC